jgi:ribosomal protein S21
MLRRLKKAVQKAQVVGDWKRHQHFAKPSERRRQKRAQARKRRGDTSGVV